MVRGEIHFTLWSIYGRCSDADADAQEENMGIKENIEKKIKANAKKIIKEINVEYITYVQLWEEFHEAKKQENDWRKLYSDICCRQQLMLEDEEWLRAKCYFEASKAVTAGFSSMTTDALTHLVERICAVAFDQE